MPQFDVSTFPSQLFWLLISFLALFLFTKYVSGPRIAYVLKSRQSKIEADLNQAEAYHRQIEESHETLTLHLQEARVKSRDLLSAEISSLRLSASKHKHDVVKRLAQKLKASEEEIETQKQEAVADMQAISAEVACAALEKFLTEKVDPAEVEQIVAQHFQTMTGQKVA